MIDMTRVLDVVPWNGMLHELCAEVVANYYSGLGQLAVDLRAFLRTPRHEGPHGVVVPPWLPQPEIVAEEVEVDVAHALAKDIFATWCRRVLDSRPMMAREDQAEGGGAVSGTFRLAA